MDSLRHVLERHEIVRIDFHTVRAPGGWWLPIAVCKCGHTSPPEQRAGHLAAELIESGRDA